MTPERKVAAIILAAGSSRRMGDRNKLTETIGGISLIRRATQAALDAGCDDVVVVTGHDCGTVEPLISGLPVRINRNPDYSAGMSTSLQAGLAAISPSMDGAIILLADMPHVAAPLISRMIAEFRSNPQSSVIVPVYGGQRGNPVLWGLQHFSDLMQVRGDTGGRALLRSLADDVGEIQMGDNSVFTDIDTPEDLREIRARAGE